MNRFRRALLVPALFLAGCARHGPEGAAQAPFKIKVQLDWVAEPEHGAFYTAEALGYFKAEGLDVELLQGGPNAYALAKVGTGQVQLAQSDSANVLVAIQAGAPLVDVASIFQHDPGVLMMQESNPVRTWADLAGRTVMARPEWAFLPYLRRKYGVDFNVIPHNFDLGRLAVDPNFIQQGYYIAEPYHLEERGIRLKYLHVRDTGFDSYTTLVTNRNFTREHPAELRAFLRALYRGWKDYIERDPGPAHSIMLRINPKVTAGYLDWSRDQIIRAHLARDKEGDYLAMDLARYARQIGQLEELGILRPGAVTAARAADPSFLPAP